jgi:hypothetical protein
MIEAGPFTLRPWERDDTSWLYRAQMETTVTRWGPPVPVGTAVDAARFVDLHARAQPEDAGAWFANTSPSTTPSAPARPAAGSRATGVRSVPSTP